MLVEKIRAARKFPTPISFLMVSPFKKKTLQRQRFPVSECQALPLIKQHRILSFSLSRVLRVRCWSVLPILTFKCASKRGRPKYQHAVNLWKHSFQKCGLWNGMKILGRKLNWPTAVHTMADEHQWRMQRPWFFGKVINHTFIKLCQWVCFCNSLFKLVCACKSIGPQCFVALNRDKHRHEAIVISVFTAFKQWPAALLYWCFIMAKFCSTFTV